MIDLVAICLWMLALVGILLFAGLTIKVHFSVTERKFKVLEALLVAVLAPIYLPILFVIGVGMLIKDVVWIIKYWLTGGG